MCSIVWPLGAVGFLVRAIAEAALAAFDDAAIPRRALLELEAALDAGEIDAATYEGREAALLLWLDRIRPSDAVKPGLATSRIEADALDRRATP
jgi:hypothetical protein